MRKKINAKERREIQREKLLRKINNKTKPHYEGRIASILDFFSEHFLKDAEDSILNNNIAFSGNILDMEFLHSGSKTINKERFNNIRNAPGFNKPRGGLWCCAIEENNKSSIWTSFVIGEDMDKNVNDNIRISLKGDSKIYVVNNAKDYMNIIDKYNNIENDELVGDIHHFDYEAMSKDYDGIYFTYDAVQMLGNHVCAHRLKHKEVPLNLYLYDCDSLILYNIDCIESQEYFYNDNRLGGFIDEV